MCTIRQIVSSPAKGEKMKTTHALMRSLLIAAFLIASCGGSAPVETSQSTLRREQNPAASTTDVNSLADENNTFALDLYQTLRTQQGNLILSPYSISLALAMTYAGARGETESQMAQTLRFTPQEQLHPAFNALDLQLEKKPLNLDTDQEPLQLNIANAVWAEQTHAFQSEYLDVLARNYGAGIQLSDFISQYEPARKEINRWVSDKTEDRINDLLPEGSVNSDTRMVLVNAIYFKADWLDQFEADDTYDAPFNLLDGSQIETPMMGQHMFIPYLSGSGYQATELPYSGDTAAMTIILPDQGRFEEIESALSPQMLTEILGGMSQTSVTLRMPKFTFESSFSLRDALSGMGMSAAFDPSAADFSGMTGKQDLFISEVIHKAFVAVDEEGTEAAAATAVMMEATSALLADVRLVIDRPFIFFIRDLQTGQILFMGRMVNPK
jgi:serpin B